jgi:hypothetical protein
MYIYIHVSEKTTEVLKEQQTCMRLFADRHQIRTSLQPAVYIVTNLDSDVSTKYNNFTT